MKRTIAILLVLVAFCSALFAAGASEAPATVTSTERSINAEEYKNIDIQFRDKIKSCEEAIQGLEERMKIVSTKQMSERPWMKLFKKYENAEQIDRQLVVSLLDNIIVYDKKHIEIQYRFGDEINDFLACYGKPEAMEG